MADVLRFIIGAAVGSFVNVLALRYKPGGFLLTRDIAYGRSHCPYCKKNLKWFELVPVVSFAIQRGRCRDCGHRLTLEYPLVEIISGLVFVFVPLIFRDFNSYQWILSSIWISAFCLFLLVVLIDLRHYVIPDEVNILLAFLGIAATVISFIKHYSSNPSFVGYYGALFGFKGNIFVNRGVALAFSLILFGLLIVFSKGKAMGMGDLKLMGALSFLYGWPDIILVAMLSFISGALMSLPLLIRRKKGMKDAVPFGPFIVFAGIIVFFFGYDIIYWYFKIFGIS